MTDKLITPGICDVRIHIDRHHDARFVKAVEPNIQDVFVTHEQFIECDLCEAVPLRIDVTSLKISLFITRAGIDMRTFDPEAIIIGEHHA